MKWHCVEQLEYNQRKKEEGKKTRLEKEQVQDLLFAAFEKHQYYNVKDLVRITNQPIVSITTISYIINMVFCYQWHSEEVQTTPGDTLRG